jgi:hypothetical protein
MITKDILISLVAELCEMLNEYGAERKSIIHTLKHYGFNDKQIRAYFIVLGEDSDNE